MKRKIMLEIDIPEGMEWGGDIRPLLTKETGLDISGKPILGPTSAPFLVLRKEYQWNEKILDGTYMVYSQYDQDWVLSSKKPTYNDREEEEDAWEFSGTSIERSALEKIIGPIEKPPTPTNPAFIIRKGNL